MVAVTVSAPARLHLGFLDLNGALGRRFGSLGVAISDVETCITVTKQAARSTQNSDPELARAARAAQLISQHIGLSEIPQFEVKSLIPPHAGLGSGTQLALAIGRGVASLYQNPITTQEIAVVMARGARSGIGVEVFEHGGFVIDVGRGSETIVPPPLCRLAFPSEWPILLLSDVSRAGISGNEEKTAFKKLQPMSDLLVGELCRHTLMGVVPAVIERDFARFSASLEFIQLAIGDHFAPFQGGGRFTSPAVEGLAEEIMRRWPGVVCGQSSWGPTGFVFCPSDTLSTEIYDAYCAGILATERTRGAVLSVHQARNQGATLQTVRNDSSAKHEQSVDHL